LVLVAILLSCERAVNQLDVPGVTPQRRCSMRGKGPPIAGFWHRLAAGATTLPSWLWSISGGGRVLLLPLALL